MSVKVPEPVALMDKRRLNSFVRGGWPVDGPTVEDAERWEPLISLSETVAFLREWADTMHPGSDGEVTLRVVADALEGKR